MPQPTEQRRFASRNRENPVVPNEILGRTVPSAVDIEAAVLGALMLEKEAFTEVCDLLRPESFYEPKHAKVYEAIQSLGLAQDPIDLMTVTNRLRQTDDLDSVGGPAFLASLSMNVASAAHIVFHAHIVAQKYLARELISFASKVENSAFDESNDIDDVMQEAERTLFDITQKNLKKDVVQIDPVLNAAIDQMRAAGHNSSGLSGVSTGFRDLDKLTSGWQASDLIIIAARPAMGKTAFVLSMALNVAMHNDPVAVFSLEMSNIQLVNRLISNACELPGEKIKSGALSQSDWGRLTTRISRLQGLPLFVDDTSGLSIMELSTKARRLVREHGIKLIVIDYLQLMTAGIKLGSREQEVSTISRTRGNKDKRPQLSDLRESGAIEQDADIVCFIHRPEYYLRSAQDSDGKDIRGRAEFIVAKHRNGRVDTVPMRFRNEYVRFENWDETDGNSGEMAYREASDNVGTAVPVENPAQAADDIAALGLGGGSFTSNESFSTDSGTEEEPF